MAMRDELTQSGAARTKKTSPHTRRPAEPSLKLAEKYWRRTGIATPKCPRCGRGNMECVSMCCGGEEPAEDFVCRVCGHTLTYKGIFAVKAMVEKFIKRWG